MKYLLSYETYSFQTLNEGITTDNYEKALELIIKYLHSKIGKFYLLPGAEMIIKKSSKDKLIGVHYIHDKEYSKRI